MCVIAILSHFFKKQTVPQDPEGPSVPSSTSVAEQSVVVSTWRLRTELSCYLVYFWKGYEEHDTNLLCFELHGSIDPTVVLVLEVLLDC